MNDDLYRWFRGPLNLVHALWALALAVALMRCQAADNVSSAPTGVVVSSVSQAEAKEDFDLMRLALEEAHTGLYRYRARSEMDRLLEAQRAKLNKSITKTEFLAVLAETLAGIKCGHTGVIPDDQTRAAVVNAPMFPLGVSVEGSRLMVLSNETPNDRTIVPGMEIMEINGRGASDILKRILPTIPSDGEIETRKRITMQREFGGYYWLLIDQTGEFRVTARDTAGKRVTARLPGVRRADWGKNSNPVNAEAQAGMARLQWSQEKLAFRFLKDPEVALIRLRSLAGEDYPKWIENTFRMLREKGTKVLVLDLRGNGGGMDEYGAMLVSYLTDKPFRYFDRINLKTLSPSFKSYTDWNADLEKWLREGVTPNPTGGYLVTAKLNSTVAEQQPAKHPFLGKVLVLTDGGTFSTAADVCAVTHHLKRATFIGEETGGGYCGNNSGLSIVLTLPKSKARVKIPMYEYWRAFAGCDQNRRGTLPDHTVEAKAANLLRGLDEPLDVARKLAAQLLNQSVTGNPAQTPRPD